MRRYIFTIIATAIAFSACSKTETSVPTTDQDTLCAQIEQVASTKTVMDVNNHILWSEGDQVVAFMKSSYGHKYQVKPSFVGKSYADFSFVSSGNGSDLSTGTEWDHNVVYYPYSDAVEAEKSGSNYSLSVILPAEQTYAAESFGNGAMVMVAVSEDKNFTFRNVLGGMKLQLKGTQTVTSITLLGKNSEKLSGAATVTAYTDDTKPAITMASDASTSVTLNCGSGVQLNESTATEFILALPPVTFNKGFTVTVTSSDSQTYTVETDKLNEVIRSSLLVMPPVTLGASDVPEITSGDYVDEYGINHGQGVKIGETVWAPVNCGYHATDFKYGKLYQWGRKYGQGYDGFLYDINGDYANDYIDADLPTMISGPVSLNLGQSETNGDYFYKNSFSPYDWLYSPVDELWNLGTENSPVKTEYDPCPSGWRVPTYAELDALVKNKSSWTTDSKGQVGYWFSGASSYTDEVPQVFFPAAGYRYHVGGAFYRGYYGIYWSSRPGRRDSYSLYFYSHSVNVDYSNLRAYGYSIRCVLNAAELVPVSSVTLNESSLIMDNGETYILSVTISPSDANHKSVYWWSDDESIAIVDNTGKVTAVSGGSTTITVMAGMSTATCAITVYDQCVIEPEDGDYVDEYGINHGPGIKIGETVWAPVNCGYHATDFKYGKLYQWGRKYGQGYSGSLYDESGNQAGEYLDATIPTIEEGGISIIVGSDKNNENVFYLGTSEYNHNWVNTPNHKLWNSGTESDPAKTEYDPCPVGWRVPTYAELDALAKNKSFWTTDSKGQVGYWFSGASSYTDEVPQVFLPAAGYRDGIGFADTRGFYGCYWSSLPYGSGASFLYFFSSTIMTSDACAAGYSVRCVQVTD